MKGNKMWANPSPRLAPTAQSKYQYHSGNVTILNNLAWQLAANPDKNVLNSRHAVLWAEKAARLTKHENPHVLDTLAVAYASSGDFVKAFQTVTRSQPPYLFQN